MAPARRALAAAATQRACRTEAEGAATALLPTLSYGFYPAFLEYPGSTSLSVETHRDVVIQIARSIAGYGSRRIYVLNTGISTLRPLRAAAEWIRDVYEAEVAAMDKDIGTLIDGLKEMVSGRVEN